MFDHISIKVHDFGKSVAFYRAALAPLGFEPQHLDADGKSVGFGPKGQVALWIAEGASQGPIHLAFKSSSRAAVAGFYDGAVRAGGRDNGGPALRPDYAKDYYAAFVIDPDGNNVEAVTFAAAGASMKPVYYIGIYDIDKPELFEKYPPRVLALLPKYGGEVLASSTSAFVIEGQTRKMNAIIRFPSREAALGLYNDPEYQEAKAIRQTSTSHITMVLVDAF